jgi:hypothetical protein
LNIGKIAINHKIIETWGEVICLADINEEIVGAKTGKKDNRKNHKLETSISDAQYTKAHIFEFFRRPMTQVVILLSVALLVQALLNKTFVNPEVPLLQKVGIVAIALVCVVGMPLFVRGKWKFIKENNDFWLNEQRYTLNVKGVGVLSHHGERRLQWREIKKIYESDDAILFTLYKFHMVVLPLEGFSEDERHQIRELIRYNTRNLRVKVKLAKKG